MRVSGPPCRKRRAAYGRMAFGLIRKKSGESPSAPVPAAGYLTFAHYVRTAKREFGGTTGDLSGWFLQRCEFCTLAGLVLAQRLEAL